MARRGPYQKYLRCQDKHVVAKIPKQTKWNRKKKVSTAISEFLFIISELSKEKRDGAHFALYVIIQSPKWN